MFDSLRATVFSVYFLISLARMYTRYHITSFAVLSDFYSRGAQWFASDSDANVVLQWLPRINPAQIESTYKCRLA